MKLSKPKDQFKNLQLFLIPFVLINFFTITYLTIIFNPSIYTAGIIKELNNAVPVKLEVQWEKITIWPLLAVSFKNLVIKDKNNPKSYFLIVQRGAFVLSWKSIFYSKKFILHKLLISDVIVKFNKLYNSQKSDKLSEVDISKIISILKDNLTINEIHANNLTIEIGDIDLLKTSDIILDETIIIFKEFNQVSIYTRGFYENGKIEIDGSSKFDIKKVSIYGTEFNFFIKLSDIPLHSLQAYLKISFPDFLFSSSRMNVEAKISKKKDSSVLNSNIKLVLNNFGYREDGRKIRIPVRANSSIRFNYETLTIIINDTFLNADRLGRVYVSGYIKIGHRIYINLNIIGKTIDIDEIIRFSLTFSNSNLPSARKKFDPDTFPNIYVSVKIKSSYSEFRQYKIKDLKANIEMKKNQIYMNVSESYIYDGKMVLFGKITINDTTPFYIDGDLKNISIHNLSRDFLKKPYIHGKASSIFRLRSYIDKQLFLPELSIRGDIKIDDGLLFEEWNFLYPVISLKKVISIKKNNNLSAFKTLHSSFYVKEKKINCTNIVMKGKELTSSLIASGGLSITFDKKIHANITVSAGEGFFGKAIKIPIIYYKDSFQIEPIWAASAIAGGLILSPVSIASGSGTAAIVGGLAGSAISDKLNSVWTYLKKSIIKEDKGMIQKKSADEESNKQRPE